MDSDGSRQIKIFKGQGKEINILQRYISYVGDVLSTFGIRCVIQIDNGHEWFILGSRYDFLLNFRLFLVILYISYEILK